jgi:hypothetical protein
VRLEETAYHLLLQESGEGPGADGADNGERAVAKARAASFASLPRGKFRCRYDALLLVILKKP